MPAKGTPAIDACRRAGIPFDVLTYEPPEHHGRDRDERPSYGLEAAYADSYAWFEREGRDLFEYDFSADDALLAQLTG